MARIYMYTKAAATVEVLVCSQEPTNKFRCKIIFV